MSVLSNINPNFPLPGIDQSTKGFRDNFATAKQEIENLQAKQIQFFGDVVSAPVEIGTGRGILSINTTVLFHNVAVTGNNHSLLWNYDGTITSSNVYYDTNNVRIGIETTTPRGSLDAAPGTVFLGTNNVLVITSTSANATVGTTTPTGLQLGTNNVPRIYIDSTGKVGINVIPDRTLDVLGNNYDVARFTSTLNNTDVAVRLRTAQVNSSVAWTVENENNYAGGIRADKNGFVSLHAGESPGSGMQNGSRALVINPVNQYIGIGTDTPYSRLEVHGNLHVYGSVIVGSSTPTLLGSRGGNAALANLITLLAQAGLINDGTSP